MVATVNIFLITNNRYLSQAAYKASSRLFLLFAVVEPQRTAQSLKVTQSHRQSSKYLTQSPCRAYPEMPGGIQGQGVRVNMRSYGDFWDTTDPIVYRTKAESSDLPR